MENGVARIEKTGDGRGARCVRRASKRNMPFSRKEPGGGIESHPAGAWQENLSPGMQICEVAARPSRTFKRFNVGCKLDQIARYKARSEPKVTQDLDQQPRRIATGSGAQRERLLTSLYPRLHSDHVAYVVPKALIQADEEIDGAKGFS